LLSQKQENDKVKTLKEGFKPLLIPILITVALIFPANFSTAAIVFLVSLILLFVGQVRFLHIFLFVIIILTFGITFIFVASNYMQHSRVATWKNRIEHFFNQDQIEESANFQANQAKIAIATAGIMGKGPGNSVQKNILPHPYSDFIFAIIVEEYGLIGAILLIGFYLILLYRAIIIVKKSTGYFASFLTIGLTLLIIMQAFVNIGVAINLFPVTGQTLPLISMGGTSLIFSSAAIGMILSVSKSVNQDKYDNKSKVNT
ncbi:MAG TPA: cell division protein FtsW, partial [Bacteroidales bacterium]|nr:cell division protein FtsW [Bacteroidales bacterium]